MYKLKFWTIVLSALLIFSACEEESDDADDHDHEHFDPHKWELQVDGEPFMIIDEGEFDSGFSDHFHLELGTDSPVYSIVFYDHDGDLQEPDLEEYSFAWKFDGLEANTQSEIAEIINTNGEFSFSIKPLQEGSIDLQLMVYHGSHADVKTPMIEVEVE